MASRPRRRHRSLPLEPVSDTVLFTVYQDGKRVLRTDVKQWDALLFAQAVAVMHKPPTHVALHITTQPNADATDPEKLEHRERQIVERAYEILTGEKRPEPDISPASIVTRHLRLAA